MNVCRCGHERAAHEHYRPGTDCALCPATCPCYRRDLALAARLRAASWLAVFLINVASDIGRRPRT